MQKYVFLVVVAVVVFVVATQMRLAREHVPTKSEIVIELLEDYAFMRPKYVDVLFKEEHTDKERRENILIMVLKTNDPYQPKAQLVPDQASRALEIMQKDLPDYDFGEPVSDKAEYYRMLSADSEWTVSLLETSKGKFSRWKRVTDMFSIKSNE